MSSTIQATAWHRTRLLASSFLLSVLSLGIFPAKAQQDSPDQLPQIEVSSSVDETRTRAKPISDDGYGPLGAAPSDAPATTSARQFAGTVGQSTTVITAKDIAHSPAPTVQEIIAQSPGVQLTTLYGGVNGAQTNVDVRGFGGFATANTLVLINGRRVNDIDLVGIDLSTIPRDSIERIEITRGNSGAVLYGDNAVGGVINIVTKAGVSGPPISMRSEFGVGSFNQHFGSASVTTNQGPWSMSVFANAVNSDGYRINNALKQQSGFGEIRYTTPDFTAFFNLSADNQELGLPGGRIVNPSTGVNELVTARNGTNTPFDFGNKQGVNTTAGFTKTLWNGGELIVDGGLRDKTQQAGFFGNVPLMDFNARYVDTTLQTLSLTPRLSIKNPVFGLPSTILTGIDYYNATYHSNRSQLQSSPPLDVYDLTQRSLAAYWQQTIGIFPTTDLSYGGRIQQTSLTARDTFDPSAPGYFGQLPISPLDSTETNHALHIGIEHRFNEMFTIFGRAAEAFRTPNVDERVAASPIFDPLPRSFALKTQTSDDIEAGFRIKAGKLELQSSIYNMDLLNEIHFDPVNFINYNLDPTRRYGSETSALYRASDTVLLRGSFAYTRAVFREGQYDGNDIPLVSRYTASAGVTWNAWQHYLVVDATVRYWSSRRMDNDQHNVQSLIPANATADLKLSGQYEHYFWSLSVNNVFNALYYDYAIASPFTPGAFSAYPLPGRTYMVKAGVSF